MPVTRVLIHPVLGVAEAYHVPEALLDAMLDDAGRGEVCTAVAEATGDMAHDGMCAYFQGEQGDRDTLKQDLTTVCSRGDGGTGARGCGVATRFFAPSRSSTTMLW